MEKGKKNALAKKFRKEENKWRNNQVF